VSAAIAQARAEGARLGPACAAVGLTLRTFQRWHRGETLKADARRREHRPAGRVYNPSNRLSQAERDAALALVNEPRFASSSPHQIVAILADEGHYLASESTLYRLLRAADQLTPRARKAPPRTRPQPWEATGPNQVWSWDITYLATTVRGTFFYLYLILDIYSRKIVGWEVYPEESAEHAAEVFKRAHLREAVGTADLVLHSDNGHHPPAPGRRSLLQPAFGEQRQPLLGSHLRHLQGLPHLPREALRQPRRGPHLGRRLRRLVQRNPPPQRPEIRHPRPTPPPRRPRPARPTRRPLPGRPGREPRTLVGTNPQLGAPHQRLAQSRQAQTPTGPDRGAFAMTHGAGPAQTTPATTIPASFPTARQHPTPRPQADPGTAADRLPPPPSRPARTTCSPSS
jgi:hypothetical protein